MGRCPAGRQGAPRPLPPGGRARARRARRAARPVPARRGRVAQPARAVRRDRRARPGARAGRDVLQLGHAQGLRHAGRQLRRRVRRPRPAPRPLRPRIDGRAHAAGLGRPAGRGPRDAAAARVRGALPRPRRRRRAHRAGRRERLEPGAPRAAADGHRPDRPGLLPRHGRLPRRTPAWPRGRARAAGRRAAARRRGHLGRRRADDRARALDPLQLHALALPGRRRAPGRRGRVPAHAAAQQADPRALHRAGLPQARQDRDVPRPDREPDALDGPLRARAGRDRHGHDRVRQAVARLRVQGHPRPLRAAQDEHARRRAGPLRARLAARPRRPHDRGPGVREPRVRALALPARSCSRSSWRPPPRRSSCAASRS